MAVVSLEKKAKALVTQRNQTIKQPLKLGVGAAIIDSLMDWVEFPTGKCMECIQLIIEIKKLLSFVHYSNNRHD